MRYCTCRSSRSHTVKPVYVKPPHWPYFATVVVLAEVELVVFELVLLEVEALVEVLPVLPFFVTGAVTLAAKLAA